MIKENFKKKLWISFGIILGAIIIASVALYILSGDLDVQAKAIVADRAQIETQDEALSNLANLKASAPQAATYQAAINQLLPGQYGLVDFGQWLTARGQLYGVSATFSFQGNPPAPAPGDLGTAPFSLTAQGPSIASLDDFLKDIETEAPGFLLSINSFTVTNNGSSPSLTAQGVLFFQ